MLANAYHLVQRPGVETVRALGGLHALMGWRGPILTDSGGYQLMSLADLGRVEDEGVHYRSHVDGRVGLLRPEAAAPAQGGLGVAIPRRLDEAVRSGTPAGRVARAIHPPGTWPDAGAPPPPPPR